LDSEIDNIIAAENDEAFNWLSRASEKAMTTVRIASLASPCSTVTRLATETIKEIVARFAPKLFRNCFICRKHAFPIQSAA
jgi:hypothetical protein